MKRRAIKLKHNRQMYKRAMDFCESLATRQKEIMQYMALGYNNARIAQEMGIKEKSVKNVSQINGYYENPMIKILVPEKLQKASTLLRKIGFEKTMDDFELSMNRAVEKAAPKATQIFINAVKQISFDDARKILNGEDNAATQHFKEKTSDNLFSTFKPIVSQSMNEVDVTKYYKDLVSKYSAAIPFTKAETIDLDDYVTRKGLDGLFYMMAQEEKKIRNNPVERTTDLLKKVFG